MKPFCLDMKVSFEQDKVNTADSAFIFLKFKVNGKVGQGRENGVVWSGLC